MRLLHLAITFFLQVFTESADTGPRIDPWGGMNSDEGPVIDPWG